MTSVGRFKEVFRPPWSVAAGVEVSLVEARSLQSSFWGRRFGREGREVIGKFCKYNFFTFHNLLMLITL